MSKSNRERSAARDKRNRENGLYKAGAWIPISRKEEFLALVKLWIVEHEANLKEVCNHE